MEQRTWLKKIFIILSNFKANNTHFLLSLGSTNFQGTAQIPRIPFLLTLVVHIAHLLAIMILKFRQTRMLFPAGPHPKVRKVSMSKAPTGE